MVSARICLIASLLAVAESQLTQRRQRIHHKMFQAPGGDDLPKYEAQWFDQTLDHFKKGGEKLGSSSDGRPRSSSDKKTWRQRYYANFDHFQAGGPVFVFIGGESALDGSSVDARYLVPGYFAEKYGGAAVALEHRFYGASQPFDSLKTKHLKYLTSQQALHDLAAWQKWLTTEKQLHDSKFFCIGGSYPGNLAAWYRGEFPELTAGCWASSAPVLAAKDWPGYGQMVWRGLSTAADGTYDEAPIAKLYAGYEQIAMMLHAPLANAPGSLEDAPRSLASGNETQEMLPEVRSLFNICPKSMESQDDIDNVENFITQSAASEVQYNDAENGDQSRTGQIRAVVARSASALEAALQVSLFLGVIPSEPKEHCEDTSIKEWLAHIGEEKLIIGNFSNPFAETRAWYWQTCNEFGYYLTADGVWGKQNFFHRAASNPKVANMEGGCKKLFDIDDVDKRVHATNKRYGGLTPTSRKGGYVSNVFFSNGELDPWGLLSVTEQQPSFCPSCSTMVGALGSHCVGLKAPYQGELPGQVEIRNQAAKLFEAWGAKPVVV